MFTKILYNKVLYYVDTQSDMVFDYKYEKLSLSDVKKLNFSCLKEFVLLLKKLIAERKDTAQIFYNQADFRTMLTENLKLENTALSYSSTNQLIKGVNYAIIKMKDLGSTLTVLQKIVQKNPILRYSQITLDLDPTTKKLKDSNTIKNIRKYISEPFGTLKKDSFSTIPLLFEPVLKILN